MKSTLFHFYNPVHSSVQFSRSVMSDSATPWTAARQASLSITSSQNLLKLMSIESVMPSNHLLLCCPLLLPPSIFPSISIFSNEWIGSLHQVAKVLELQLQHQSFQWNPVHRLLYGQMLNGLDIHSFSFPQLWDSHLLSSTESPSSGLPSGLHPWQIQSLKKRQGRSVHCFFSLGRLGWDILSKSISAMLFSVQLIKRYPRNKTSHQWWWCNMMEHDTRKHSGWHFCLLYPHTNICFSWGLPWQSRGSQCRGRQEFDSWLGN